MSPESVPRPLLEARDVVKAYGRIPVLRGASFEVRPGEILGIVGENRSGKSTLLRIVVGLLRPSGGTVRLRGRLGYCDQEPLLFPMLTVAEHFSYFASAYGLRDRRQWQDTQRRLLDRFGYARWEHTLAERLSGGTRQNSAEVKRAHPEIGTDVKVMGIRHGRRIQLTVACAFVGRHIRDLAEYSCRKGETRELIYRIGRDVTRHELSVDLNLADDIERGEVYLTVTGTSAEAGDDGEVGRGNRAGGLITPYRPMSIEAVAGKNPVSHVGKLYNLLAGRIAAEIVTSVPEARSATCVAVSQIGRPVDEPHTLDLELALEGEPHPSSFEPAVRGIVAAELARVPLLRDELLAESIMLH